MMQIKNYMNLQPQQRLYEILPLVFQQAKGRPLAPASSQPRLWTRVQQSGCMTAALGTGRAGEP